MGAHTIAGGLKWEQGGGWAPQAPLTLTTGLNQIGIDSIWPSKSSSTNCSVEYEYKYEQFRE